VGLISSKKEEDPQPEPEPLSDEQLILHRHRYKEARRMGMQWRDAKLFASSQIDIEEMRSLARKGCPPEQLLRILL
jgi:hypothetical protein